MNNPQVAAMLNRLADMMELHGDNPFKIRAYRRAARAVENCRVPLDSLEGDLENLPGIGKGTVAAIREIMETGRLKQLENLERDLPEGLWELLRIPGLGPKSVHTLHHRLGVTNLEELEQAVRERRIRDLPGFGAKKEQNIREGIRQFREKPRRLLLVHVLPVAEALVGRIRRHPEVRKAELAGSLRRMKETVKDIDLVVATGNPESVAEFLVNMPEVTQVVNRGETKVSLLLHVGFQIPVDVRLVSPEQFAAALHHFTGSREHNVRIRQRAKQLGWKVSEYGIHDPEKGEALTFEKEEELYRKLRLPYLAPELREDRGELERDVADLPDLIDSEGYRGDLHMHTRWSDGGNTIREMALAARKRGYEYIAITDHSQSLKVAGGLTAGDLLRQREEIAKVNEELEGITVLAGVEMDILPDGHLDFPDEVLRELDVVIASIHSGFKQDGKTLTRRMLQAMENPFVHMIAHPTGRLINRRDPYAVNVDRIFQGAKETGTILELNSNPHRLDLNDVLLKKAKEEYGVLFTVNTDAHSTEELSHIRYGIATARRGWLEENDVINTLPLEELLTRLKRKRL